MENGQYKLSVEHRLSSVETKVDTIMDNHLPHIQAEVTYVKNRMNWIIGLIVTTLISVVLLSIK